jgi:hypothetical protein
LRSLYPSGVESPVLRSSAFRFGEQGIHMNWEALGAIGEIVGAVAVVLTLGYLAMLRCGGGWCSGIRFFLSRPAFKSYWTNMRLIYTQSFQTFIERELLRSEKEDASQPAVAGDRP